MGDRQDSWRVEWKEKTIETHLFSRVFLAEQREIVGGGGEESSQKRDGFSQDSLQKTATWELGKVEQMQKIVCGTLHRVVHSNVYF